MTPGEADPVSAMPSDYVAGYPQARAHDPALAATYIRHTGIGDPLADAAAADCAAFDRAVVARWIEAGMRGADDPELREAPASLRAFFEAAETPPAWLDLAAFGPGVRMFHRNSYIILMAFVTGVLIEGFTTNIAKSFMLTGRVQDRGVRRLGQNNRHMTEIFFPGGLERQGDGWKLSVRIRLVHAQMRHLLQASEEWDADAWGTPISAAHLGFAIAAFSARLLKHMRTLGASYSAAEAASFMAVWRYTGYLMGIPETILFRDEAEALQLYDVGRLCEPDPSAESIVMSNALVNSAPLIAGAADIQARRALARYVYRISRGLIGQETADALRYPPLRTFGVIPWFRWQVRLGRLVDRWMPGRRQGRSFTRFGYLLAASTFDPDRIRYSLPDHISDEHSSEW